MSEGDYRFRTEVDEQYFFSDIVNHCTPPTCTSAQIAMPTVHAVTVGVLDGAANPQQDVVVYAFEGTTYAEMSYTGSSGKSDELGEVNLELPTGNYWFAYKHGDAAVDAGEAAVCVLPGCIASTLTAMQSGTTTYVYDPLNRLTGATEVGVATREYGYTYDAVGNRLTKTIDSTTVNYGYDIANRLTSVDGVTYTWDNNGNLLSDGVFTYTYDAMNRLASATDGVDTYAYAYNASGDRLQQTVNAVSTNYTLDLAAGLTQVLDDGTNVYLYGRDRLAQEDTNGMLYFIPDALGSVRVLADASGDIVDATSYSPYGVSAGMAETAYGFTGEWTDGIGLVNLRARYYAPSDGRFLSKDPWQGSNIRPQSLNQWVYAEGNPTLLEDPSGLCSQRGWNDSQGLFTKHNCDLLEKGDLEFTEDWYYAFADYVQSDLPQTARNMRHFLNGSGSEFHLRAEFMQNKIYGWPKLRRHVNNLAERYAKTYFSANEKCPSAIFARGYTPPYHQASTLWPFDKSQLDISGALGSFRLDVLINGEVEDINSTLLWQSGIVKLSVHLVVLDYYNWHKGLGVTYQGNGIQDEWANNLVNAGMARPFLVRGDLDISIEKKISRSSLGSTGQLPPSGWVTASCVGSQFDVDQDGSGNIDYCGNPMH